MEYKHSYFILILRFKVNRHCACDLEPFSGDSLRLARIPGKLASFGVGCSFPSTNLYFASTHAMLISSLGMLRVAYAVIAQDLAFAIQMKAFISMHCKIGKQQKETLISEQCEQGTNLRHA